MTLTKKITVTYGNAMMQVGQPENSFTQARWDKLQELMLAGKTDGDVTVYPGISMIKFTDQAAAEEYRDCILDAALASNGTVNILSTSITDL
jgi:hypothetical protein